MDSLNEKLTRFAFPITVSKARRPKFELTLRIIDLNNVPLVSGTSYTKWHLPASTSAEHRGRTDKAMIKEHKVSWDYIKTIPVRLTIDKNNNLTETLIHFEVVQDYSAGTRSEKIILGQVVLNLAEYVEESEGVNVEEGIVRRYLMQESKINSTLKIGITMKQLDGERNFVAPPLKTAPVFVGIAGIMTGEQVEQDELGSVPNLSKGRDHTELQDMYRRALAASWGAQAGELPADQCIEDIFSGGDGWKKGHEAPVPRANEEVDGSEEEHLHGHRRNHSNTSLKSQSTIKGTPRLGHKHSRSRDLGGHSPGGQSPEEQTSLDKERGRTGFKKQHELDELELRNDLVAWRLPGKVSS